MTHTRVYVCLVIFALATRGAGQDCTPPAGAGVRSNCGAALVTRNSVGPTPLSPATTRSAAPLPNQRPGPTFQARVEEVALTVSVTDKHGRPVAGLTPQDLTIVDEKQPVANLRFAQYDQLRLRVGVLVDWSESVEDRFAFERQAATDFLRQVMRPGQDEGFVLGFGAKWELTQPLTHDPETLVSGLQQVKEGWLTSLFDAIAAACTGEMAHPAPEGDMRRAIILLSDGQDTASVNGLGDAVQAAQEADVAIYPIAMRGHEWDERGERVLRELARATGGRAYIVRSSEQYLAAFRTIQQDLGSGYRVWYKPPAFPHDGRFRRVEVALHDHKLQVHARAGYFAPKE